MNNFSLVLILPILLTIISASTLLLSFKGKIDASGQYFLLSEILWLFVLIIVFIVNIEPSFKSPAIFYTFTAPTLLTEVTILLSIRSLTQEFSIRIFFSYLIFIFFYCGFIEFCRNYISPTLPIVFFSIFSLFITAKTYIACYQIKNDDLKSNLFLKWIAYSELALILIHILRFCSFFSNTPAVTINPSPFAIFIFSCWLAINFFRYFSYQSLRVSWVDQDLKNANILNQNFTKLVIEKNRFLQGLISSNRAIGLSTLAHSLAHQLSQPITGLSLQTEAVKRDLIDRRDYKKSIETLNVITDHLGKLVNLVNNLRKLFNRNEAAFEFFSMQKVCDEVLEIIKPKLDSERIVLSKTINDEIIVLGDPVGIQQIIINILNNAIESISNSVLIPREINFSIFSDQGFAVISIKDSGGGIRADIENSLFELYQSTKPDGLGIGLWLSKAIAEKHEGVIIGHNSPNGGAIFEIRIPIKKHFDIGLSRQ